ncbi:MAG: FkbM family methyltransferase, partial [bacterium]|nr:FkbM family methyltransferase [bacterium]
MQLSEHTDRVSPLTERVRKMAGSWPFGKGTSRIASLLGTLCLGDQEAEVIGRVGSGGTLSRWQPDEFKHPTFWYLYEKPIRRELAKLLSPGSVYVDIGAHRGWLAGYGLDLVSPGGLVIACEPFPRHAERLRALATLNPGKNLIVENVAVSRAPGTAQLLASDEQQGTVHTIVQAFAAKVQTERRPIEVLV